MGFYGPREPRPKNRVPLTAEEERARDYWHAQGMPAPLTIDNGISPARLTRPGDFFASAMVYLTHPDTRQRHPVYARHAALFAHANQLERLVRESLEHMPPELAEIAEQVLGMLGPEPAEHHPAQAETSKTTTAKEPTK